MKRPTLLFVFPPPDAEVSGHRCVDTPPGNRGSGVVLAEGTPDDIVARNVTSTNGANGIDVTADYFTMPPTSTDRNHSLNNLIRLDGKRPDPTRHHRARGPSGHFRDQLIPCRISQPEYLLAEQHRSQPADRRQCLGASPSGVNADVNTLLRTAIHHDGALGVDLGDNGVTANDPGDFDSAANPQLNFPMILYATITAGVTTSSGFVENQSEVPAYRAQPDPSGYGGEDLWWVSTRPAGVYPARFDAQGQRLTERVVNEN